MSDNLKGVYKDIKKDNSPNYRASITINQKHISLGGFDSEQNAHEAYSFASTVFDNLSLNVNTYPTECALSFEKYISLINFRDNKLYISNPIYLHKTYFSYFYDSMTELKFDMDDLFYFSSHKLMKRGNHFFVSDFGNQDSLRTRYGIRPFSVVGRDFVFLNNDYLDYRRENIFVINKYYGVTQINIKGSTRYKAVIHINGNFKIGVYKNEIEAAIAYNKAIDIIHAKGLKKEFPQNYIEGISNEEYLHIYENCPLSEKIISWNNR